MEQIQQIQMVPVAQLQPHEKNPRVTAAEVADLVASIREHGVEIPLVAAPASVGDGLVVLGGHRRLTAALEAGLTEVPVQVRTDLTDARAQLVFMASENVLRVQLTPVEESRLVLDLHSLGWTQAEIAQQTALGKKRVSERMKLGKLSEDSGEKLHRGQITVDDALVLAEFADDPEAVHALEETIGHPSFDYRVSDARRRREDRNRADASRKEAKKKGLRIAEAAGLLADLYDHGLWTTPALDAYVADGGPAGDAWTELLNKEHSSCPGHAGVVLSESRWLRGESHPMGALLVGCDQHETLHPAAKEAPAPEAAPDPWEDLSADDFATAKIHRGTHLAATLPHLDLTTDAQDLAVHAVLQMGWGEYYESPNGIAFLEAITGAEGKAKITKVLKTWPLATLVWLNDTEHDLKTQHEFMGRGARGSSYWAKKADLRTLLERTNYQWTDVEKTAILLATGTAHDATEDEDGAALAEGGEAA